MDNLEGSIYKVPEYFKDGSLPPTFIQQVVGEKILFSTDKIIDSFFPLSDELHVMILRTGAFVLLDPLEDTLGEDSMLVLDQI